MTQASSAVMTNWWWNLPIAIASRGKNSITRMIPRLKNVAYEDSRLKDLKLWSLEDRRIRADLIEVFKITHGLSSLTVDTFFVLDIDNRTRGHPWKLKKRRSRSHWSEIPFLFGAGYQLVEQIVQCNSLCCFSQQFQEQTTKNVVERWVCFWALAQ